jgi:hypothetical protein
MKILVSTVGEIDARKRAILNNDFTKFMKATAGKKIEIEIPTTASINDLIAGVRELGDIKPHLVITSTAVLKGKTPVSGSTLTDCGLIDGSAVTMKFTHKTGM